MPEATATPEPTAATEPTAAPTPTVVPANLPTTADPNSSGTALLLALGAALLLVGAGLWRQVKRET